MRLTLRTLLSYLDDTLEPEQAKLIGEKVTESDIAPDLVERIKRVTRRRSLAAPPVAGDDGDNSTDPNTVAEYLDNSLPENELEEIEQGALNSDSNLAEIATCHQILTLVLGEPAKVPPTARQHMYRLVKGKESNPYRRPLPVADVAGVSDPAQNEENSEADEALLLGLSPKTLKVPIIGSLIILALLVGVIWMAIPSPKPMPTQGYVAVALNRPEPEKLKLPVEIKPKVKDDLKPKTKIESPVKIEPELLPVPAVVAMDPPADAELLPEPRVIDVRPILTPPNKPDGERRAIAKLDTKNSLLLYRPRETGEWNPAVPNKDLFSTDHLLSLPGCRNEIKLESGIRLLLWGTMPEYHQIDPLDILESHVVLYSTPLGIDADFTLESGRVFITRGGAKEEKVEPMKVRVRFKEEIWELTLLDADTEVCIDLLGYYGEGVPFSKQPDGPSPTTEVYFGLLKGRAGLRMKFQEYPMLEAPTRLDWESVGQDKAEPRKLQERDLEWWNKTNKTNEYSKALQAATAYYVSRFANPKIGDAQPDVAFYSAIQANDDPPARRFFAIRALQALNAVEYFATGLDVDSPDLRRATIRCIQHWTGLSADRDLKLYKVLMDKKNYKENEAQNVLQLLHPFAQEDYGKLEIHAALFEAMKSDKLAIRELAYKHLEFADPVGAREVGAFDSANDAIRDAALAKWKASWTKRFVEMKKK